MSFTFLGRRGRHCRLDSRRSDRARWSHYGPPPIELNPCRCVFCGCRHDAWNGAPLCFDCRDGRHCERGGAIPAESAVSVRAAFAFGDWRLWSRPECERCMEPVEPGDLARIYTSDPYPLTGHRSPADCVATAFGDPQRLIRVLRRLQLYVGIADEKGVLA